MSAATNALESFRRARERQGEDADLWLASERDAAWQQLEQRGLPTTREETWRYTNLRRLARRSFAAPGPAAGLTAADIEAVLLPETAAVRLSFVNGIAAPALSLLPDSGIAPRPIAGLSVDGSTRVAGLLGSVVDIEQHRFAALNTALFEDGCVLMVPADTRLTAPIYLLFLGTPGEAPVASHPRVLLDLGARAEATVIEHHVGLAGSENLSNTVTEARLATGARLQHYRLQDETAGAWQFGGLHASLAADSHLVSHNICLGAPLARNDIAVLLEESGAECELNGLFLTDTGQHVDNHTRIDHLAPHTRSVERYRGIANGSGRGVFNGKVVVHAGADKTDASQASNNLLLSEQAEIDTKPELEIYADDVKCAHGATVGQLDRDQLFYLLTRGMDRDTARGLLTFAFADEVIARFSLPALRAHLERRIVGRLPAGSQIEEFL